ncbi:ABC transporter permease [Deinococcus cellulosilyticus]|uniref:Multidrug ABC transporter substrate-binding protein n=1 Tax=Deinococcus cellulosilyticus (strain DSM 18568 / NBRC 106333 / KACC 11606 / 5516J-15) TaxID=1223518 RepID=A0A511N6C1_DEIC1|nr:ABC transporter permease [Deinococcus cellulosilyticus]GEM48007.1 multidrug ABC transporter substrate-binding protein [Deinococcus cellulosilyticus NBRC 106333 = KACC 11606]
MNMLENLSSAFQAIFANKLRSVLTMLGVIIGVFAVSTMLALGQMATQAITGQLNEIGGKTLFVQANYEPGKPYKNFTQADIDALSVLPVNDVSTSGASLRVMYRNKDVSVSVQGTRANFNKLTSEAKIVQGRYFSEYEEKSAAQVVVLSQKTATKLFDSENPVGKVVRAVRDNGSREEYTVIGITQDLGALFGGGDSGFIPISNSWRGGYQTRGEYGYLQFRLHPEADTAQVTRQVESILQRRRGENNFSVTNLDQFVQQFNQITVILQALLAGIGGLSLLVGGIGIMNIMLVSVTERTREIGLRKAIGAKRGTILQQFLIEAVTLTALGGIIGYVLSLGVIVGMASALPNIFPQVIISPVTGVVALAVSVLTGVLFGVWPASRAASLPPIEALRYE